MKVLHITYSYKGGAGIAALRLHEALSKSGVSSGFLSTNRTVDFNNELIKDDLFAYRKPSLFKKLVNKFQYLFFPTPFQKVNQELNLVRDQLNCEIVSLPFSNFEVHNHPLVLEADIINLHWIGGIIDYPSFFSICKKPIVWTLHDMNPFQGGFHYKTDAQINSEIFKKVEQEIIKIKEESYNNSTIRAIVVPSKWLLKESLSSSLLNKFSHHPIYNCINPAIFKLNDKQIAREKFKLPGDKIIFLFVSQNIGSSRKGYDVLEQMLSSFNNPNVLFVAVGNAPKEKRQGIYYIDSIQDEAEMALLYSASDAFILPSREDNLPNTMLESLLCGTPVITTAIGGMKEVIQNDFNGYLVELFDSNSFKEKTLKFIDNINTFDKEAISKAALSSFAPSHIAEKYANLYKSIVSEK